jgi:hypothetical protein
MHQRNTMGSDSKRTESVVLIPWHPVDEAHYQRMVDQRVACGWREEEVPEWKRKQLDGVKFVYWIVSVPSVCGLIDCRCFVLTIVA